jgi:subtilisin family serine protease
MPTVKYGTKDQPGFKLDESPDLIAVRTRSQRSAFGVGPVPQPAAAALADGQLVAAFPEAGVEVFRVNAHARSLDARKAALRAAPDTRFAGSVLMRPKSGEPVVYTENLYVRFRDDIDPDDCEAALRAAGLSVKRSLGIAPNAYLAAAPEGTGQRVFDIALDLLKRDDVVYSHPELVERRVPKQVFPQQWHLKATNVGGTPINAHANVEAAHALSQGAGVTIAVIDDGVDVDHPEFAGSGKVVAPRDVTRGIDDPRPKLAGDKHGTACAGVACAAGMSGASGVAPAARLMPIRLASGLGSVEEADAFKWAADHGADVISCSWGPADGPWWDPEDPSHAQRVDLPASTRDAFEYALTNGRGGKGCVILFAAGNGNESVEIDGYASHERVIAVAACNDRGKRSIYSDFGAAVWCAFPSNDIGHAPMNHPDPLTPGIWTTDRVGRAGYNSGREQDGDRAGHFTNSFGGTSSACPGAAGVAALVLAANPSLRWDEVRDVLRRSADRIDPAGGAYDGDGRSRFYGFGRLNAEAAVRMARTSVGRLLVVNKMVMEPIPDLGRAEGTLEIGDATPVEQLVATVRLEHTYIGDLVITLIPPPGRGLPSVVLHNRAGGSTRNLERQYDSSNTPRLSAFAGKRCDGTWTVRVEDRAAVDAGMLMQIGLQLSLPAAPPPDRDAPAPRRRSSVVAAKAGIKAASKSGAMKTVNGSTMKNGTPKARRAYAKLKG